MRLVVALLLIVAGAVYSVTDRPGAYAAGGPRAFRVATFNIHKGADNDNRYDLQRTIEAIAGLGVELVGVQEAMRNDPNLNCDDQPKLIAEGLRRLTGERWSYVYAKSWITENRTCQDEGRGDGVATEGVAFFSAARIVDAAEIRLPESRVALMARVATMPDVPVIVTHLAASRRNQTHREQQIAALMPWVAQHGPGILMGDLNARPESPELAPLFAPFKDAWVDAWERGVNEGVVTGGTRPFGTARIDFVLYAPGSPLALESAGVLASDVSDHHPVAATFRRRPALE
jgi:endonuclease/exonuclease/phosphatase family metal-dependent hydrolase